MTIEAQGPWNEEYVDYLHRELLIAVRQLDINNYGTLLNLSGQALVVDKGVDKHIEFLKQSHTKAVAINLSDCDTCEMTKNLLDKVYKRAGIKHQYFEQENAAKEWLHAQLHN